MMMIQIQMKSLYCATCKLRNLSISAPCSKNTLFISCLLYANVCLPVVEQIHTD